MNTDNNIQTRNRMPAKKLVISENAPLRFVENLETKKICFVCGTKRGYVSPAAAAQINESCTLNDFQYAEVSINDSAYVPCILIVKKATKKVALNIKKDSYSDIPF